MFKAMNYSGGPFAMPYGILDDTRDSMNLHAWHAAAERDFVLRQLRSGEVSWGDVRAPARDYTLRDNSVNWQGTWTEVHEPNIDDAAPSAEVSPREAEVAELRRQLDAARQPISDVSDPRLAPIWDAAAEVAENEGFCSEYDRLAEGLGVPGRVRTYRGVVTLRFNVYGYAEARNSDEAGRKMEARLRELVADLNTGSRGEDGDISHVDIEDSEAEDVNIYS